VDATNLNGKGRTKTSEFPAKRGKYEARTEAVNKWVRQKGKQESYRLLGYLARMRVGVKKRKFRGYNANRFTKEGKGGKKRPNFRGVPKKGSNPTSQNKART